MPDTLVLAPGVRVVRRGPDLLQVGLYDDRRVLLPRTPVVVEALTRLELGLPLIEPVPREVSNALHRLQARRLLCRTLPTAPAAATRRVTMIGHLPGACPRSVLTSAGLSVTDTDPDAVLVVSAGEPPRETIDPWVRRGTPHLVLRLVDGDAVLGPFTVPGESACLRCIDAHRAVADPDHIAVLMRYVRAGARGRADGTTEAVGTTLTQLALAWAVHDMASFLAGGRPATWARTVHLGPDPAYRREVEWTRHPTCGCSWGLEDQQSGTMEG